MSSNMEESSEDHSQQVDVSDQQFSPSQFDFEAFMADGIQAELHQPPPEGQNGSGYNDCSDYNDFSDIDLAPRIPYPMEEEDIPGPSGQENTVQEKDDFPTAPVQSPVQSFQQPLQVPPRLEPPKANHGSSSVPITVTSPVDQVAWQPYAIAPYGSQPMLPQPYFPRPQASQPYVSQHFGRQNYAPRAYAPRPYVSSPYTSQPYPVQPNVPKAYPPPLNTWQNIAPITRPPSAFAPSRPMNWSPGGTYLNPILNDFSCPSNPLHVIDNYKFPFEDELQRALEVELHRQNEIAKKQNLADYYQTELRRRRESNEALEAKFAQAAQDIPIPITPAPTPIGDGTRTPRNKRPINISNTDPKKWYRPLPMRPDSWGSINPDTNDWTFNYTADGELNPRVKFSVQQMSEYISSRRATLWIQTVPADSGRRYPTKYSDKCRFLNCPDPNHTIRKGDFRVAFDEHPYNFDKDPFHNAAYTHLFCIEKFLDFPQVCKTFDVRPDTRQLREGKNKMAITRDHKSMEGIVLDFIQNSLEWRFFQGGIRPLDYYEHTLCSKLTREHLTKQSKHIQTVREQRGGNTIDIHQNNLDVYVANQTIRKQQFEELKRASRSESGEKRGTKRASKDKPAREESEESGLDDDILQRGLEFTAPVPDDQPQGQKRRRRRKESIALSPSSKRRQTKGKERQWQEDSEDNSDDFQQRGLNPSDQQAQAHPQKRVRRDTPPSSFFQPPLDDQMRNCWTEDYCESEPSDYTPFPRDMYFSAPQPRSRPQRRSRKRKNPATSTRVPHSRPTKINRRFFKSEGEESGIGNEILRRCLPSSSMRSSAALPSRHHQPRQMTRRSGRGYAKGRTPRGRVKSSPISETPEEEGMSGRLRNGKRYSSSE